MLCIFALKQNFVGELFLNLLTSCSLQ